MAIHPNLQSMLHESLPEMLLVAKYCIEFRKDIKLWPAPGCYGYPAALLLLSIVDSIGSYVEQGKIKNHFKILNNNDYYGLSLSEKEIRIMHDDYRHLLAHNTLISTNVELHIGSSKDPVLQNQNGRYSLNLIPFYNTSVRAVNSLLNNPTLLNNNQTILNVYKKSSTRII
jgi:hypothetical protein